MKSLLLAIQMIFLDYLSFYKKISLILMSVVALLYHWINLSFDKLIWGLLAANFSDSKLGFLPRIKFCYWLPFSLQDGGGIEVSGSPTEKAILHWAVKVSLLCVSSICCCRFPTSF